MKMVVICGTGLIAPKAVAILRQGGHEVVAGSPKSGVNSITGKGLKEAMAGAQVAIDLTNSPSFEDRAVMQFFETSWHNLFRAETRSSCSASCRAVHPIGFQPIAAEDVAAIRRSGACGATKRHYRDRRPGASTVQGIVARHLIAIGDPREVVGNPNARYCGARSKSCRSCRWAMRGLAASVLTSGSVEHWQAPDPTPGYRRKRLDVSYPLCTAYRDPTIRQCLR